MEQLFPFLIVFGVILLFAVFWRRPRGPRRNIEEAIASDVLAREQDEQRTEDIYNADRFNVPGGNRKF